MPARLACFGSLFARCDSQCRVGVWSIAFILALIVPAFGQGGGAKDAGPADPKGAAAAAAAADAEEDSLPAGLLQSRDIPPEMEITKELYTDGDETEFVKKYKAASEAALKSSNLTDDEKKALDALAKYWVFRLTMKKYRDEEAPPKKEDKPAPGAKPATPKERLPDIRRGFLNNVRTYAKTQVAREHLLKAVTDRCAELLDNHFAVRLNAVWLLGQLQADNGTPAKSIDPAAFAGAYQVLLNVLKDDKQHIAVKIAAVRGLERICQKGLPEFTDKRRGEIALTVVAELKKKETHWWYQMSLAKCLAFAGVTYDPAAKQNPVVLQALAEVLVDKKRHWEARTSAAWAIGRLPLDNNLNMAPVVYEIVNLGQQMAVAYNANPKRDSWPNYYFTLYLTFRPERGTDKILAVKRKPGLLDVYPNNREVKEAYEQIVIMSAHVVNNSGKPFDAAQMKDFTGWLQRNTPANGSIVTGSPSIVSGK